MNSELDDLIEKLKSSIGDSEVMHCYYDDILRLIAKKHEPELLKRIDKITKGRAFWYA